MSEQVLDLRVPFSHSDIRRQYKKMAQQVQQQQSWAHSGERHQRLTAVQVHPDKCSCFGAAGAFSLLGKAADAMLKQAAETGQGTVDFDREAVFDDDPEADWTVPNAFGKSSGKEQEAATPAQHTPKASLLC